MEKRQQAHLAALERIPLFLDDYTIELGKLNRSPSSTALNALVRRLTENRETQATAAVERRSCAMRRRELRRDLRTRHLRPIAAIANAELANAPAASALRCPPITLRDELFLAQAESMGQYAAKHKRVFLRHQLPRDFVQQLRGTVDAIDHMIDQSAACRERRKLATAALAAGFREAVRVVSVLDALVKAQASRNLALRAAWDAVRRGDLPDAPRGLADSHAA